MKNRKNYLSRWIANLGVVPLLMFFLFLLRPIFLLVMFLLALVCFVLDAIYQLPVGLKLKQLFDTDLPIKSYVVKMFLLFLLQIYLVSNYSMECYADQVDHQAFYEIIMAKGEHREFTVGALRKYSMGNGDVVGHKYWPKKNRFLIKGKKIGHSELVIWVKGRKKKVYSIYVLSKSQQMKLIHLKQALTHLGLDVEHRGPLLMVEGEVRQLADLQLIKHLKVEYKNKLHFKAYLSQNLRNEIIGEVYYLLFKQNIRKVSCSSKLLSVNCYYDSNSSPDSNILKYLKKNYLVNLLPTKFEEEQNYRVTMKLIQMERVDGAEFSLGLHSFKASLKELFEKGIEKLFLDNSVILKNQQIRLKTLAAPEALMRSNSKTTLEMGANIPYETTKDEQKSPHSITRWQFAGLKVKLHLKENGGFFEIDHQVEFTRPLDLNVVGSKGKGTLLIREGEILSLFQISLSVLGQETGMLPGISAVPILGEIFKSTNKHTSYKKIYGLIKLEVVSN